MGRFTPSHKTDTYIVRKLPDGGLLVSAWGEGQLSDARFASDRPIAVWEYLEAQLGL